MEPPRVFVSYSHDSEHHDLKVLELCNRLRQGGIDAYLDRYEDAPPQGWSEWSLRQITIADFVLSICTERYRERFEAVTGEVWGVSFEATLITREIYQSGGTNRKFIPVLFADPPDAIPSMLRQYTFYRYPDGYDELYRRLTDQPEIAAPPLGALRTQVTPGTLPTTRVHSKGAVEPGIEMAPEGEGSQDLNSRHLSEIQKVWLADKLSIVAGAGVSVEAKLPTWTYLLRELLAAFVRKTYAVGDDIEVLLSELQQRLEGQSPLIYAQFVRSQFNDEDFTTLVHGALYPGSTRPLPGNFCRALARLGNHLNSILTFNYDELIGCFAKLDGQRGTGWEG